MVGTGWEVETHPTPSVITTLSGAEHLGEANNWSGRQRKQEKNSVKSSSSKSKGQEGRDQISLPTCKVSGVPDREDALETILSRTLFLILSLFLTLYVKLTLHSLEF